MKRKVNDQPLFKGEEISLKGGDIAPDALGEGFDKVRDTEGAETLGDSGVAFRELVQDVNDMIYTVDLSGNLTWVNRAFEGITGYTAREATQLNMAELVAPEYLDMVRRMLVPVREDSSAPAVYELEIIRKD
jgi:PAS domain-containing protein